MSRFHRVSTRPAAVRVLVLMAMPVLVVGTAVATTMRSAAAAPTPVLGCGDVVTTSVILMASIGPCNGDGLILAGSGITLNLGGFSITGKHNGPQTTAGVFVNSQSNDIVEDGTVTGFDAGVAVLGGGYNTITGINAHDNINLQIKTGNVNNGCNLGDGITTDNSVGNLITGNTVVHNGPFSGISLVDASTNNTVSNNFVEHNNVINLRPNGMPGVCGAPFSRPVQDIGIRVEGPGASGNTVTGNTVIDSAIGGITIHGYVYCPPTPTGCGPSQPQNTGNMIENNYVSLTGQATYTQDPLADGIGVLRQGPAAIVGVSQGNTIENNRIFTSYRNGIFLGNPECGSITFSNGTTIPSQCQPGPYTGTIVSGNTIQSSLFDGVSVAGGSINNSISGNTATQDQYDGYDANTNCTGTVGAISGSNSWSGDTFSIVNQPCVM